MKENTKMFKTVTDEFLEQNPFKNDTSLVIDDSFDMEVGDDDELEKKVDYDTLINKEVDDSLLKSVQTKLFEVSNQGETKVKKMLNTFVKKDKETTETIAKSKYVSKKQYNPNTIEGIISNIVNSQIEPLMDEIKELKEKLNSIYK